MCVDEFVTKGGCVSFTDDGKSPLDYTSEACVMNCEMEAWAACFGKLLNKKHELKPPTSPLQFY